MNDANDPQKTDAQDLQDILQQAPEAEAHAHAHASEHVHEPMDPAQQSVADALRVTFAILKVAMVVLLVIYAVSNLFNVPEQAVAVKLRFGEIVGAQQSAERAIIESGGPHFAWPFPIEQVVFIPKSQQRIELGQAFWYQLAQNEIGRDADELAGVKNRPLNPELDGSLLTGDANIAHARWTVLYTITNPVDFITNIVEPQRDPQAVLASASRLVQIVAEQGIVYAVARQPVDELLLGNVRASSARQRMQAVLDNMGAGISIDDVTLNQAQIPFAVRPAYQEVINAENEKSQAIDQAEQARSRVLGEAAGESYKPLLELIRNYERLSRGNPQDAALLPAMDQQIDEVFRSLTVQGENGPVVIGGEAASVINQARTYKTRLVAQVQAQARRFEALLPQYRANPRIVTSRLWQDTREQVLTNREVETFFLAPGQHRLDLNRDPKVKARKDREALDAEVESGR